MNAVVRLATEDDLDDVRFVGFATWPSTYGPFAGASYVVSNLDGYWNAAEMSSAIAAGNVYVAVDDTRIVGVSEVGIWRGELVMWKLYVLPDRQRSGVGRALLGAVKQRAKDDGLSLITEYVAANIDAGDFYRSQGFAEFEAAVGPLDSVWLRNQD